MEIDRGQLVAVVGAVGTGKSTLLAALLGDIVKKSGTVAVSVNAPPRGFTEILGRHMPGNSDCIQRIVIGTPNLVSGVRGVRPAASLDPRYVAQEQHSIRIGIQPDSVPGDSGHMCPESGSSSPAGRRRNGSRGEGNQLERWTETEDLLGESSLR